MTYVALKEPFMMALTKAWMPGVWGVAGVVVGAEVAEAPVVAVAVARLFAAAPATVVTLEAPPKMLASETVFVAGPDAAVLPLNF